MFSESPEAHASLMSVLLLSAHVAWAPSALLGVSAGLFPSLASLLTWKFLKEPMPSLYLGKSLLPPLPARLTEPGLCSAGQTPATQTL